MEDSGPNVVSSCESFDVTPTGVARIRRAAASHADLGDLRFPAAGVRRGLRMLRVRWHQTCAIPATLCLV
jgi:hypothetical protein